MPYLLGSSLLLHKLKPFAFFVFRPYNLNFHASGWSTIMSAYNVQCASMHFHSIQKNGALFGLCSVPKLQPFLMICDLWRKLSIQPYQIHLSTNATDWTKCICAALLFLIHLLFDTLRICIIIITSQFPIVFSSFVSKFWFLIRPAFYILDAILFNPRSIWKKNKNNANKSSIA